MLSGGTVKGCYQTFTMSLNINTFRISFTGVIVSFTGVIVSFTGVFCWFYWSILLVLLAYLINLDNYHTR